MILPADTLSETKFFALTGFFNRLINRPGFFNRLINKQNSENRKKRQNVALTRPKIAFRGLCSQMGYNWMWNFCKNRVGPIFANC